MNRHSVSSNTSPRVSVIIPAYNEVDYIEETLTSLLKQTYDNLQLIVVDDGSDDKTIKVVRDFADEFDDLRILENRLNMGQSFSRNRGMMNSDGKYIVFHDADDLSTFDRIEKQVEYLESNPEVGVLGSAYYYLNPYRNQRHVQRRPTDDDELRPLMARECMVNLGTAMFRAEALGETRLFESNNVEGYELMIKVAKHTKLANLDEPLYVYRINDGSRSQNRELFKKLVLIERSFQAVHHLGIHYTDALLSFGWLLYIILPTSMKSVIRHSFSPTDDDNLSENEAAKLETTLQRCA